ncbi:MAG: hypothetical protein ACTS53_01775 [Candidatus Hodgkinia cicadicola]
MKVFARPSKKEEKKRRNEKRKEGKRRREREFVRTTIDRYIPPNVRLVRY